MGGNESVVAIHGGTGREDRLKTPEAFRDDSNVQVRVATDAVGEGINLQRAHHMVNDDLPWSPNRLQQRFGRIHRIGQTEVCQLWTRVAEDAREGDVYRTLLEKLEPARQALGGQVFDVLGTLQFEDRPLWDLRIDALRCGERAEARRLQPYSSESVVIEAFSQLVGTIRQLEPRRYEITPVPAAVRNRDRLIRAAEPVLSRYERIVCDKSLLALQGQVPAALICPGHSLLDATLDLTSERHRDLLRRGTDWVDARDSSITHRVLVYLEHAIRDARSSRRARLARFANKCSMSNWMQPDMRDTGITAPIAISGHRSPETRYRRATIPTRVQLDYPGNLKQRALGRAIAQIVPNHLRELRARRLAWTNKTRAAVKQALATRPSIVSSRSWATISRAASPRAGNSASSRSRDPWQPGTSRA